MSKVILFNKPYGVICQFSPSPPHPTLKDFIPVAEVYPAGRLDTDSEGLLVLTDDGKLQAQVSEPKYKKVKTYFAQVDGVATDEQLAELSFGVNLGDFITAKAQIRRVAEPDWLWERNPSIRVRKALPTSWLAISISEGKNRQVRRMTAKVGLPTLRLIRYSIGGIILTGLEPGQWCEVNELEFKQQLNLAHKN